MTTSGDLYTFGSKENGKLGHGRDSPSGSIGHVTQITVPKEGEKGLVYTISHHEQAQGGVTPIDSIVTAVIAGQNCDRLSSAD